MAHFDYTTAMTIANAEKGADITYFDYATVKIVANADLIAQEIAHISNSFCSKRQVATFRDALSLTDKLDIKTHELCVYKEDELTADVITQAMNQIIATGNALCDAVGPEFWAFRNNEQKAAVKRMLTAAERIVGLAEELKLEAE